MSFFYAKIEIAHTVKDVFDVIMFALEFFLKMISIRDRKESRTKRKKVIYMFNWDRVEEETP